MPMPEESLGDVERAADVSGGSRSVSRAGTAGAAEATPAVDVLDAAHEARLEQAGRMLAGIVHEINNPLNFAITGLYTLKQLGRKFEGADQETYCEILQDVEDGIDRI